MEAKKLHDLPSASWRPEVVWQSKSEGLRIRKANGVNPIVQRPRALMSEGRRRWMFQLNSEKMCHSSFFYSIPMDWMMPAHIGEGRFSLLSLLIQVLTSPQIPTQTHSNNVSPAIWAFFNQFLLTHKSHHNMQSHCTELIWGFLKIWFLRYFVLDLHEIYAQRTVVIILWLFYITVFMD